MRLPTVANEPTLDGVKKIMPDVTMLDTSIFGAPNRRNSAPIVAEELEQLVKNGEEVVVCASAFKQLENTPNPGTRAHQLQLIRDLDLKVQGPTSLSDRSELFTEDVQLRATARGVEVKDLPIIVPRSDFEERRHCVLGQRERSQS
jgi:hypothetical protein